VGFNVVGGRQGWDVTTVSLSSAAGQLSNGQTTATLRAVTTGDSFAPTAVGFAIDVNAPSFADVETMAGGDPLVLAVGESSTITVQLHNAGLVDAADVLFRAVLPDELDLTSFAIDGVAGDADGNPVDAAGIQAGVPVGDVVVDQTLEIVFEVTANAPPSSGNNWVIVPQFEYDYVTCEGEPPLTEPQGLAPIFIDYDPSGSGSETGAETGTTSADGGLDDTAGSGGGSGSGGASGGASEDAGSTSRGTDDDTGPSIMSLSDTSDSGSGSEDGCGCRSSSRAGSPWLLLFAPLALRRRRR
jgi:hypothetical protein